MFVEHVVKGEWKIHHTGKDGVGVFSLRDSWEPGMGGERKRSKANFSSPYKIHS